MITYLEFDSGDPHYMNVIDRWTERREPVWRIHYIADTPEGYDAVVEWLDNNCERGYDYTYRFNSGSPYLSIELLAETDVIAFKMRFV